MTDISSVESEGSRKPGDSAIADGAAMVRLRNGDDTALNELMDRWRKPILAYLYRMTGDYEAAADLSQEVFVRLFQNRRHYKPRGSFSAYVFTIASNLARNHFRWKKRHPEAELKDSHAERGAAEDLGSRDPSMQLESNEDGLRIKSAVGRLPEKLRTPVILFHFNELPQAEVATILGCSEKAVESRLYRARKKLRELLA